MSFESILDLASRGPERHEQPPCLHDLNLDQLVGEITAIHEKSDLASFFYGPLATVDAVLYRHEALRDLEDHVLLEAVREFGERMGAWRGHLARIEKAYYAHQRERLFLTAVHVYCDAVRTLGGSPRGAGAQFARLCWAAGLPVQLRRGVTRYVGRLRDQAGRRASGADPLHGAVKGGRVTVGRYEAEADYSAEIGEVFAKFSRRGPSR